MVSGDKSSMDQFQLVPTTSRRGSSSKRCPGTTRELEPGRWELGVLGKPWEVRTHRMLVRHTMVNHDGIAVSVHWDGRFFIPQWLVVGSHEFKGTHFSDFWPRKRLGLTAFLLRAQACYGQSKQCQPRCVAGVSCYQLIEVPPGLSLLQ